MNIQFHRHSSHRGRTQADSNSIDLHLLVLELDREGKEEKEGGRKTEGKEEIEGGR